MCEDRGRSVYMGIQGYEESWFISSASMEKMSPSEIALNMAQDLQMELDNPSLGNRDEVIEEMNRLLGLAINLAQRGL